VIHHFLNPPNWFTSASIFCSTYAMALLLTPGEPTAETFTRACVLVVFGGIFDMLDGRVARLTNRYSDFGVQLDSIADIIGFGVAPAMLAWTWQLHELGSIGMAVTFWYVLSAAFRLARFNVNTVDDRWQLAGHSQGLTSTMSGGILVTAIWVFNGYLSHVQVAPLAFATLVALLGFLMISSVPCRNFKDFRANVTARRLFALSVACCLTGALVFDPSMWFGVGAALYLTAGTADGLVVAAVNNMLGRALLLSDDEEIVVDEQS
jgi:CDP-diacylglycerol--serine O-phosphatidyltransferase